MTMVQYFGAKWDAPMLDGIEGIDIHRVPTPVGEKCMYCSEEILDKEQGLLRAVVQGKSGDGQYQVSIEPAHMECDLRAAIGDIHHLKGRCICFAGDKHEERPWREQAREVVRWVNARRRNTGQCDLQVRLPEKAEVGDGENENRNRV